MGQPELGKSLIKFFYNYAIAYPLLFGYRLLGRREDKAREYFRVREGLLARLQNETAKIAKDQPRVLCHVASVGELLQAMPVLAELKKKDRPPLIILSYTSASVNRNLPKGVPADLITPAPVDLRSPVEKFLDLAAPDLIIFSTYDLWPNLAWSASDRGIPGIMINASLPEHSGRLGFPARSFFKRVYAGLAAVGAVTEDDAARFARLAVPPDRVQVTGNCRYDQTLARCRGVRDDDPELAPFRTGDSGREFLVAGSTWPEDHARLLPALARLLARYPGLFAVIAPHEPTPAHLAEVEDFFRAAGVATQRYTSLRPNGQIAAARVILVDALGVLYKIYRRGAVAYVGGSFRQGVHSVMEPAGMKLPVVFGPVHQNSAEALAMIRAKGAAAADNDQALEKIIAGWLDDPPARRSAGGRAYQVVEQNSGATARTMKLIEKYLPNK